MTDNRDKARNIVAKHLSGSPSDEDWRPIVNDITAALDAAVLAETERCVKEWRQCIFELCEATEELDADNGFNRGRRHEAKGIRRTMGEIMSDALRETAQAIRTDSKEDGQ